MLEKVAKCLAVGVLISASSFIYAHDYDDVPTGRCTLPQGTISLVERQLYTVVNLSDSNGGIFKPNRMWAAIVDREGHLCSVTKTGDAWPGSRAIAIAKAYTANGFSNDALALSTANLYAATQPGGSLYGLNNSNPFDARFLEQGSGINHSVGGVITFGGGVALYAGGKVIGGLGVSGDSSCADHAIAYRMRKLAGLGSVPAGEGPNNTDNIKYSTGASPMGFEQPHCFPSDLSASGVENIPH
ncbi:MULTISPECIES: heme-binding protein [unclassified Caballeronia]|uniref:GlcG/HbpS family heme-binding protein n=1 Tax=unclassified Caballeronia TaxID=2646786 RepID=UPI001FD20626|nr:MULTISPECIES: heme-binding protein [unclassified Caballeronia]